MGEMVYGAEAGCPAYIFKVEFAEQMLDGFFD